MSFRRGQYAYLYILIGLVIAGLISIQLYWINKTVEVEKSAINRNLNSDFKELARQIEEHTYCYTLYAKTYVNKNEGVYLIKQKVDSNGKYLSPEQGGFIDTINLFNFLTYGGDTLLENYPSLELTSFASSLDVKFNFAIEGIMDPAKYAFKKLTTDNLEQAFDNNINIGYAINKEYVDREVKEILKKNDLDTNYLAEIKREGQDAYLFSTDSTGSLNSYTNIISAPFFDNDMSRPYLLLVGVEEPYNKIVSSLSVMMITSVIIVLILILLYAYFIRTIIKQRRLSEMKNAFINNITHEFRTPITNISLAIENWKDTKSNPDFYYNIIDEENKHLEKNVDQILQLATLKHNGLHAKHVEVNLNDIINKAADGFSMQLNNLKGAIEYNLKAEDPYLYGDERELLNMLQNLISNAIKYNNKPPNIKVSTYMADGKICIEIKDNGIGMSAQTQKHIFDRFYRHTTGDRHDVKGFGLGLSYVKHIVDNHNGQIQVSSKPEQGTTFSICLPKKNRS